MPRPKNCTHIKVTGVPCGSPALRGEDFCYFHQRMIRTVKGPDSRVHHAALLEDDESIQASLIEVVNALLRGTIEVKRAELVLRALNIAVRNIRRVRFTHHADMIRELPTFPTDPEPKAVEIARAVTPHPRPTHVGPAAPETLPRAASSAPAAPAASCGDESLTRPNAPCGDESLTRPDAPCGDGSLTRLGGPALPGRSAFALNSTPNKPVDVTMRKPPVSVKLPAPQERKITAHAQAVGERHKRGTSPEVTKAVPARRVAGQRRG